MILNAIGQTTINIAPRPNLARQQVQPKKQNKSHRRNMFNTGMMFGSRGINNN